MSKPNVIHLHDFCEFSLRTSAQVVPTMYTDIRNVTVLTNQYSVSEYFKSSDAGAGANLPGVFCFFDLSPIKVLINELAPLRNGHGRPLVGSCMAGHNHARCRRA